MTPTLTRRPRPAPSRNVGEGLLIGTAVGAVATVALFMAPAMTLPRFVDHLSVNNPTPYALEVDVRGRAGAPWLDVGSVRPESRRNVYRLIDEGDRWLLRFVYAGEDVGALTMSRSQLQRNGWRIDIPAEVGDRLRAEGVGPSAR